MSPPSTSSTKTPFTASSSLLLFLLLLLTLLSPDLLTPASASRRYLPREFRSRSRHSRRFRIFRRRCESQPDLVCVLTGTSNVLTNSVTGQVHFQSEFHRVTRRRYRCVVRVTASVSGLSPGNHGFHIHSYGDLRKNDGTSAGGHFANPADKPVTHGYPESRERHWGDLGNVMAEANGNGTVDFVDHVIKIDDIRGRGMIIHAQMDMGPDEQPTGAAGPRHAMCVIGIANPDL